MLAAAIRCNADAIVTFNLKDFPSSVLNTYSIDAIHPDDFVCFQIDLSPGLVCNSIREQRLALKNPPKNRAEFFSILQKQQLPQTVSRLREFAELI